MKKNYPLKYHRIGYVIGYYHEKNINVSWLYTQKHLHRWANNTYKLAFKWYDDVTNAKIYWSSKEAQEFLDIYVKGKKAKRKNRQFFICKIWFDKSNSVGKFLRFTKPNKYVFLSTLLNE